MKTEGWEELRRQTLDGLGTSRLRPLVFLGVLVMCCGVLTPRYPQKYIASVLFAFYITAAEYFGKRW